MLPDSELYKYKIRSCSIISDETHSSVLAIKYFNGYIKSIKLSLASLYKCKSFMELIVKMTEHKGFSLFEDYTEIFNFKCFKLYINIIDNEIIIENTITNVIFLYENDSYTIDSLITTLDSSHRETAFDIIKNICI